jgi:hypothetical protein
MGSYNFKIIIPKKNLNKKEVIYKEKRPEQNLLWYDETPEIPSLIEMTVLQKEMVSISKEIVMKFKLTRNESDQTTKWSK